MSSAWLQKFRPGSFRGVPFKIDSHEYKGGRRKVDHEFPRREQNRSEDLGKKTGTYSLNLFVIADDYFPARDALQDALDKEGSGLLVHPYLGSKQVQSGPYTLSESVSEGRIARFTVEFSDAGEALFPESVEDNVQSGKDNADDTIDKSKGFFESALDVANQPAFLVNSAADAMSDAMDFVETSVAKVTEPVTNITFAIRNIKAQMNRLIRLPGELADRVGDIMGLLYSEFDADESEKISGNMNNLSYPVITGNTNTRDLQRANETAIENLVKEQAVANQSKAALDIEYPSIEIATEIRDNVAGLIGGRLELIEDDDLFQSAKDMQSSIINALPPVDTGELIKVTPKQTTPALILAHDLFQDLDKEQEIIDENNIEHPGFVEGGTEIEVSSD